VITDFSRGGKLLYQLDNTAQTLALLIASASSLELLRGIS
jgi:hypothetical protein